MAVTYLAGHESITPAKMNTLVGGLDAKMDTLLSGRSPILAFAGNGTVEPKLWGKPFWFTTGRTTYAQRFPNALIFDTTATDPISGVPGNPVRGVRAYDHSYFTAFLAHVNSTILTYDKERRIGYIANATSHYPPGLAKTGSVSFFEHSLEAHTKSGTAPGDSGPRDYFLYENRPSFQPFNGGGVWPTKFYRTALAEIVCEGRSTANLAVCSIAKFKFDCLRLHNLSAFDCVVTFPGGATVTLDPFECCSYRRNEARTAFERSSHRYFQTYRNNDPRHFWFFASHPAYLDYPSINDNPFTSTSGMQANNLSCPTVIHEWIKALTVKTNWAWFERDPHEVCDIWNLIPELQAKFGNPATNTTKVGDLIHHKGRMIIARTAKVAVDGEFPVTFEEFEFRGYDTLVADLDERLIDVTVNGNGNLELTSTDPDNEVDLIPVGTNFLKNSQADDFRVPTSVDDIESNPREIESGIFEYIGAPHQDRFGVNAFTLRNSSDYRILKRRVVEEDNLRTHLAPDGTTPSTIGGSYQTLEEVPEGGGGQTIGGDGPGIHSAQVSDLKSLLFNRNETDAYSAAENVRVVLRPSGPVILFDEIVEGDAPLPDLTVGTFSAASFPTSPSSANWLNIIWDEISGVFGKTDGFAYAIMGSNSPGVLKTYEFIELAHNSPHPAPAAGFTFYRMIAISVPATTAYHSQLTSAGWKYDGVNDVWRLKHAINLRGHGPGWGQHGKEFCGFFSCLVGRAKIRGYTDEQMGTDGADYGYPAQGAIETGVKVARRLSKTELTSTVNPGGRFMVAGTKDNLDGLIAFLDHYQEEGWYTANRGHGGVMGHPGSKNLLAFPLKVEDYDMMAEAINQLKEGSALSYKAIRIVYGNQMLDLSKLPRWDEAEPSGLSAPMFGLHAPAPVDAFISLYSLIDSDVSSATFSADITAYWLHWLAARSVTIKTAPDDLPASVATFQVVANKRRGYSTTCRVRVTNVAFGGFERIVNGAVGDLGGPDAKYFYLNGDIELSMDDWTFGAEGTIDTGFAVVPHGAVSATDIATGINLNTCYSSMKWLNESDFQALVESLGFDFVAKQMFIPLKLEQFVTPAELVANDFTPSTTQNSRVWLEELSGWNYSFVNQAYIDSVIENFDENPDQGSGLYSIQSSNSAAVTTKQIGFRLADDAGDAEFKLPVPLTKPPVAYFYDNRSEGRLRRSVFAAFGHQAGAGLVDRVRPIGTTINAFPPWGSSNPTVIYYEQGPNHDIGYTNNYDNPVHLSSDLAIGDETADRYAAYLNAEREWFAFKILASDGLDVSQQIALFAVAHWESVKDWWLLDDDSYLQSITTGFDPRNEIAIRPPRWVAADIRSRITLTPDDGLYVIKPNRGQMLKLIYDPTFLISLP